MCLLFESISFKKGHAQNLKFHQERIDESFKKWNKTTFQLQKLLVNLPPFIDPDIQYKIKLIYDKNGPLSLAYIPYVRKEITDLRLVEVSDTFDYERKFLDRRALQNITDNLLPQEDALLYRDGLLLESSFCNIALLHQNQWYTPAKPLHKGSMLRSLIAQSILEPRDIRIDDLELFSKIRLFNALNDWDNCYELSTEKVTI